MKIAILLCCLVVSGGARQGQQTASDPYSLGLVKDVLDRQSAGILFGWDVKSIPSLGDRCAIAILKIVELADLTQPKTVKGVLRTVHLAFARPELIQIKEDRKPKVTLFLLTYLKDKIHDPDMQHQIEETTEFVRLQSQIDSPLPAGATE